MLRKDSGEGFFYLGAGHFAVDADEGAFVAGEGQEDETGETVTGAGVK